MNSIPVLITGTSRGLGRALAHDAVARGRLVFALVRRAEDAEGLRMLGRSGDGPGRCVPIVADVTDADAVARARGVVERQLSGGGLAALVNNAALVRPGPFLAEGTGSLARHLAVNVEGPARMITTFFDLLERGAGGRPGRIVNIGSTVGLIGSPFLAAYGASKFALEGLSQALRTELRSTGVRVITVIPDAIRGEGAHWPDDPASDPDVSGSEALETLFANYRIFRRFAARLPAKGVPLERVTAAVNHAVEARYPRATYLVVKSRLAWRLVGAMPPWLLDRRIYARLGLTDWREHETG